MKTFVKKYLSEKERAKISDLIISFFLDERDEKIGIIAASKILDFFESEIAPKIYLKAMLDSKKIAKEQFEELDFKLTEKTLD